MISDVLRRKSEYMRVLRRQFERRWLSQVKKSRLLGIDPPGREELLNLLLEVYQNSFKCEYCGSPLKIKDDDPPYFYSFSFDHKTSLFLGGDNSIGNFAIVCHRCNVIKGTMTCETYKKLISPHLADQNFLNRVFLEIWQGRLADKLQREKLLRTKVRDGIP